MGYLLTISFDHWSSTFRLYYIFRPLQWPRPVRCGSHFVKSISNRYLSGYVNEFKLNKVRVPAVQHESRKPVPRTYTNTVIGDGIKPLEIGLFYTETRIVYIVSHLYRRLHQRATDANGYVDALSAIIGGTI